MSTTGDLATAAADVTAKLQAMRDAREAVLGKNDDVAAVLTTEQAALDTANQAYTAALVTARDATGWTAANVAFDEATSEYLDAKANFETVLQQLEPLE